MNQMYQNESSKGMKVNQNQQIGLKFTKMSQNESKIIQNRKNPVTQNKSK